MPYNPRGPLIDGMFLVQLMVVCGSQADRSLNWTVRMNKVVDRVTQE